MREKVKKWFREQKSVKAKGHLLVAVSGGADSVALLYALVALVDECGGPKLSVAHLNHGIRGKDADGDACFVQGLAKELGVECIVERRDVVRMARKKGVSLEMAAREARYKFFARTMKKTGAGIVATAHTANDQAETVLLKLARGAGSKGLGGIAADCRVNGIRVVRPILKVWRREVEEFLGGQGIGWREDSSNRDMAFLRNRTRHVVLPMLQKQLNPRAGEALIRTADLLRDENEWMDECAGDALKDCIEDGGDLSISNIVTLHVSIVRRVLRLWLVSQGVDSESLDFAVIGRMEKLIKSSRNRSKIDVSAGRSVCKRNGHLVMLANKSEGRKSTILRARVKIPGKTVLEPGGHVVEAAVSEGIARRRSQIGVFPAMVSICKSAVGRKGIYVRSWRAGDRMRPLGLGGSKKVQDILVDEKVAYDKRAELPLFECGGEIIWIPGYHVAEGWEVTDATAPAVQLCIKRGKS